VCGRLRDNYRFGKSGSISKNSVYRHYLDECRGRGLETDINQTYFGKLVKKAFAGIQYNRYGPSHTHHLQFQSRALFVVRDPIHVHGIFILVLHQWQIMESS
jgi:hypothetical protein